LKAVYRQGFTPPKTSMEVQYARDTPEAALKEYDAFKSRVLSAPDSDLVRILSEQLDLEMYLEWIALNTILVNGDYVDELWLSATDTLNPDGTRGTYFSVMGWDYEDICVPCHYQNKYAFKDRYGLVYCAESELDRKIFSSPVLYGMYVEILERMMTAVVTEDVVKTAIERTLSDLLPYFRDPAVCRAMIELQKINPGTTVPDVAEKEIRAGAAVFLKDLNAQRKALMANIGKYKNGNNR
jgi:hypothetical protein